MRRPAVLLCAAGCVLAAGLAVGECVQEPRPAAPLAVPGAEAERGEAASPGGAAGVAADPDDPASAAEWPCPEPWADLAVQRSGRDEQGRKTWWHADGSITRLTMETDQEGLEVSRVEHIPNDR